MLRIQTPHGAAEQAGDPWACLPPDLVFSIARAAHDHHVLISMQCTCKMWHLALAEDSNWRQLVKERFGPETQEAPSYDILPAPSPGPWQQTYWRLLTSSYMNAISDANKSLVTWAENRAYFSRRMEAGAHARHVLHLHHVCWLSVASNFRGVCPGRYKLVWRLRVAGGVANVDRLLLDACVTTARDTQGHHLSTAGYPPTSMQLEPSYRKLQAGPKQDGEGLELEEELTPAGAEEPECVQLLSALHPLQPADSTFFKVALHQPVLTRLAQQAQLSGQGEGEWLQIEVGLDVPYSLDCCPVAEYDIVARLWNTTDWWKGGLLFDTVSLGHVGALGPRLEAADAAVANHVANSGRPTRSRGRLNNTTSSVTSAARNSTASGWSLRRVLGWFGFN